MKQPASVSRARSYRSLTVALFVAGLAAVSGQERPASPAEQPCSKGALDPTCRQIGIPPVRLPDSVVLRSAEHDRIRVQVLTRDLDHPWALAFLPDGAMLITERPGRLRIVRDGKLDPQPVSGVPRVHAVRLSGLLDVAIHPKFAENHLVYFSYSKPLAGGVTTAVGRGRLDGGALTDVRDVFSLEPMMNGASRIAFGRDGMLYVTTAGTAGTRAQNPNDTAGKVLRLRDDGSVPDDNPFVGRAGYRPEVFTLGHRSNLGLAVHPDTGVLWTTENGPNGGDEINILAAGRNYGWPVLSYGRTYPGPRQAEVPWQASMEGPFLFWVPSIAASGITFYTGDRFPAWKGNVFVGGLRTGELPRTGRLERIVFNSRGEEMRRESLLTELKKRVREVRQGPDGLLYVLVEDEMTGGDATAGALLRLQPAS
jgi:glucose/arabinose dehydrogenase